MDFSELVLLFLLLLFLLLLFLFVLFLCDVVFVFSLFLVFFSFSFSSFFFFSPFLIISKVAGLRAGPGSEEEVLFSLCFPFCFSCVCFKYSVKLSPVCLVLLSVSVDLLQVPGFTALAYVLA